MEFAKASDAISFLKDAAQQAYGSGFFEKTSGGYGRMGMIGDKPVKFNTHLGERLFDQAADQHMYDSCNELRANLFNAANTLAGGNVDVMNKIRAKLGFAQGQGDETHALKASDVTCKTKLLDRSTVASVINLLQGKVGVEGEAVNFWEKGTAPMVANTKFSKLNADHDASLKLLVEDPYSQLGSSLFKRLKDNSDFTKPINDSVTKVLNGLVLNGLERKSTGVEMLEEKEACINCAKNILLANVTNYSKLPPSDQSRFSEMITNVILSHMSKTVAQAIVLSRKDMSVLSANMKRSLDSMSKLKDEEDDLFSKVDEELDDMLSTQ